MSELVRDRTSLGPRCVGLNPTRRHLFIPQVSCVLGCICHVPVLEDLLGPLEVTVEVTDRQTIPGWRRSNGGMAAPCGDSGREADSAVMVRAGFAEEAFQ